MFRALFAILSLICFPVLAQNNAKFGIRGENLPVIPLTTFYAQPDETEEVFVARVGAFLDRFTLNNGLEACAALVLTDNNRLMARVTTSNSQVGCLMVVNNNDVFTGRGIHSHPNGRDLRLTLQDNIFLRGNGSNRRERQVSTRRALGPSTTDRRSGAGYLVEDGIITFFAPGKKDRIIGPVAESPLAPGENQ